MNISNKAILNSWKEIAEYVGRGIRTLQRWERDHGFPVHRPSGKQRSAVFAVASEVDRWLKTRPLLIQDGSATNGSATIVVIPEQLGPRWQRVRLSTHDLVTKTQRLLISTGQLQAELKHAIELGSKYKKSRAS
jgi:phage terminase Nu1 subunit (DNA packaging protein)